MKKICPFHRYDILQITQWLNEYSAYGWELKSWGTFFCRFQEYNGARYQYQLDMDNWENGANEERRAELEALGWEYVDTISGTRIHIYRSPDCKVSIPENKEFIEYNLKKFRFSPVLQLVLGVVLLVFFWSGTSFSSGIQFILLNLTQTDKITLLLYGIYAAAIIVAALDAFRHCLQLYRYLRKKARSVSVIMLEAEQEYDSNEVYFISRIAEYVLVYGALILALGTLLFWGENQREYVKGAFAERYYSEITSVYESLGKYPVYGSYWMNVSEAVEDELFDQIVERYAGYSSYYGNGFLFKRRYDTHDQWNIDRPEDERFEKLVIAEGIGKYYEEKLLFAQIGNDIVYLRCFRGADIPALIEELATIEYEK